MCYSKERRGFASPGLQCSPSSLPAPSAFSRNMSVCRVPLSTSFLILCRERKTQGKKTSSSGQIPTEKCKQLGWARRGASGSFKFRAGRVPGMCQNSCLWQQEGLSRLQHRFLGICGSMETWGCRNFGTQSKINCHRGLKTTGL